MMKTRLLISQASNIITIKGQPAAVTFEADINAFRGKFLNPRFYVSTSKSIIKALINMHSFEIQLSPIG